jgi:FMN phosphatase YigB (HAD superfamily)
MKIKAVFFDLDGTLLPMDQDIFIKAYLGGLVSVLAPKGYDPKAIAGALWKSTDAMVKNDGTRTNEEVFWDSFSTILGNNVRNEESALEEFYKTDFQNIKNY